MQVVRTIVWVLLLVAFLLFAYANWDQNVTVQIWENLYWYSKLPAVVVVAFLCGAVPMWLLHLATKWQLRRRIGSLERAAQAAALMPAAPPPAPEPPEPVVAEPIPEEPRTGYPPVDEHKPLAP